MFEGAKFNAMRYLIVVLFLCSLKTNAQESSFSLVGYAHVSFLGEMNPTATYGAATAFTWHFGDWRAISVAFGASSGQYSQSGNYRRIENGQVVIENAWSYTTYQRVAPLDFSYMEDVLASPAHHLYVGGGASVLFHAIEHPDTVVIFQGISPYEMVKTKATEFAVHALIHYSWDISKNWVFSGRAIMRLPIPQQELVFQPSIPTGYPGVNSTFIPSIYIGVGYRF
jgi:hypothetical protein